MQSQAKWFQSILVAGLFVLCGSAVALQAQEEPTDLENILNREATEAPHTDKTEKEVSNSDGDVIIENARDITDDSTRESETIFDGDNSTGSIFVDEPELLAQNNPNATGGGGDRTLRGFAELGWKTSFTEVRKRLKDIATSDTSNEKIEIVAVEENKFILVKRNDIMYRYNFYKTPYNVELLQNHDLKRDEYDQKEARLFHVKVIIPFIASSQVKEKIVQLHGPNTRSTFNEKKGEGADIWELEGGLIFQWMEPYKKEAFTRSVDYLSLEMAKAIMEEYAQYFDARERLLLKKILLK